MLKAFRYRLEPSNEQRQMLVQFAGCCRFIFNHGLASRRASYEASGKTLSYAAQCRELTRLKNENGTKWLRNVHSQVLQQALKDLDSAYQHFFKRLQQAKAGGFPTFRKRGRHDSFRYPQGVKLDSFRVFLPKIGWVRYRNSRPVEGALRQATVKREGEHWFICLVCEIHSPRGHVKPIEASSIVGIDVGLKYFATLSTGEQIKNPRFLKRALGKLRSAHRALERKKRHSRNWLRQIRRLRKHYLRVRNQRNDSLHKVSTSIVKKHDIVVIENLNISGLAKNRRLSRAIYDAGWSKFFEMLKYKAEWAGKKLVQIERFLPTSQTCSNCGAKKPMPIEVRNYQCDHCGSLLDRDWNASQNIRAAGLAVLGFVPNACGGA